jgi:hypothetical protein
MRRGATTDYINYSITVPTITAPTTTCPGLPGTSWNATNTLTVDSLFSANGGPRDLMLCVSVPPGQYDVGAGAYIDTVTATVSL